MTIATTEEILDFWFSDEVQPKWFNSDDAFDKEIKKDFLSTYENMPKNIDDILKGTPEDVLAAIIVFDQFPRNIFRGKKKAYGTDEIALKIASESIKRKLDRNMDDQQRKFLYMPYMHSEDIKDQRSCIALLGRTKDEEAMKHALQHKETILRFGRFPHRNEILGRKSTDIEIKYLAKLKELASVAEDAA